LNPAAVTIIEAIHLTIRWIAFLFRSFAQHLHNKQKLIQKIIQPEFPISLIPSKTMFKGMPNATSLSISSFLMYLKKAFE